ncbi:MlaA family lipoprotein [Lysobacter humi (ex Lee et al. 2017)]
MIRSAAPVAAALPVQARPALALALLLAAGTAGAQAAVPPATEPASTAQAASAAAPAPVDEPAAPATAAGEVPYAPAAAEGTTTEAAPVGTPPDDTTAEPSADALPSSIPGEAATTPETAQAESALPAADDAGEATAAEDDFQALYGEAAAGATPATVYDPWERYNRQMHRFNNAVDRRVATPLARAYVKAVPRPVRTGVSNFFNNLGQPLSAINALLQGKPKQAAHSLGRFVMNSTVGIAGIFDPATDAKLQNRSEDFGQTLGVWGWKRSRYVELPLFGPRTVRDVVGMAGDAPLSPLRQLEADALRVPLQGLQLVDLRMQLMSTDALREGVEDDYVLVRDAWSQRRAYQIDGETDDGALPDYLREDPGMVPVDAMPVGGG